MLRTLGVLALAGVAIVVVALGGEIGPVDLTETPPALLAFAAVTAVVLLGLRTVDR